MKLINKLVIGILMALIAIYAQGVVFDHRDVDNGLGNWARKY